MFAPMMLLIGPCMLAAPFLIVLVPLAVVLWPVVLAVVGVAWVFVWPFAALAGRMGTSWLPGVHGRIGAAFVMLLRPWKYFEVPVKTPPE